MRLSFLIIIKYHSSSYLKTTLVVSVIKITSELSDRIFFLFSLLFFWKKKQQQQQRSAAYFFYSSLRA